ncbi:acyl-CoA dehydrogenase family protein [Pseudomonas carnis]|uniref:acyl-CoA dehydrogenase family protein n=1 Tax=Pseudomonas TaxID=286 RepID=UPI0018D98A06|nr:MULTISPECIES: acyl-CoA dehydrogenase family protein [Pseudomonas]MBC6624494.1 acyl-CoA dehydrogenase family protein [Pseudomonas sp.]MBH3366365.1 acyl-CoA dehydrogenase family protein [Pseudomonas carnis]MBJ2214895.1 acyl-CoA dehydrogenase family protein [Pseudomonas carnis]MBJ2226995.1 acyl-CoA dehydrogenase family protein [Pseudomonas sp. MF7451]MBP6955122.1 acyl-CoA dehydrogenase family protein [Pseudomonas sp.]
MSTVAPSDSQREDLLASADDLGRRCAARSKEIEANRFLPQDLAEALAGAGLYRMLTPREYGGLEVSVETFVEVIERLASYEASAAWCTFIDCTACILAAYLPNEGASELFSNPQLKAAGVFAPRGKATREVRDGVPGFRISGRWAWGSASKNADIVLGGCMVLNEQGKPEILPDGFTRVQMMVFRRDQVTWLNNWDTFGLRGSGSGEFEVHDVFVAEHHSASLTDDEPLPRTLYRFPAFGLLGIGVGAVALGIARHALDSLCDLAKVRTPQFSGKTLDQRPGTQQAIAKAEAGLRSARAFLMESVRQAWNEAEQQGVIALEKRRDIRLATTYAVEIARNIVTSMYQLGGGSSIFDSSPLQQCLRDIHVVTQHFMVSESTYEVVGRLFLGLDTNVSMF